MLIKLFRSGKGGGAAPVDYLIASHVLAYDANRDLIRDDVGVPLMKSRDPLPEVLAGDPDHTRALIDACPHAWTYRAGVISFDQNDHPTEEQQQAVMDAFDELAFAGLDRDQVDMLWVRHSHEGRVELHFCTPRMELTSGKSLNLAPPGYQKAMDALRDMLNKEHGWADPQDPARSQDTKQLPEKKLRAQGREDIQNWLEDLIVAGQISSRPDMIAALEGAGFELPRLGKTYLTVKDPDSETRWRLKETFSMQIGPERRPLRERLSENIEQARQEDQNASLLEAFQASETNIERMLKSAGSTISKDIRSSQEKLNATLERHLRSSEEQIHQLKIGMAEKERLAAKNRFLKLSAAVLISAVLTLGGILFLNDQLRWALITSAFNQTTYTEFPILIFDTKTGTYERCRDIDGNFSCPLTE